MGLFFVGISFGLHIQKSPKSQAPMLGAWMAQLVEQLPLTESHIRFPVWHGVCFSL